MILSTLAATWVALFLLLFAPLHTNAGDYELEKVIERLERDVLEFAKEVESVYQTRCKSALQDCSQSNYGSYVSEFSNPFCHKSKEFVNHNCSTNENDKCASLFSYTESTVVLPKVIADGKDGNPTGPQVSLTTTKNKILASIHHHRS